MLGVLCGMVVAGFLPLTWPWNLTLLIASSPQLLGILLLSPLLRSLPSEVRDRSPEPIFLSLRRSVLLQPSASRARITTLTILALAAGGAMAVAWSAVGQFVLPLRGSREFGLERFGVSILVALPQLADVALLLPVGAIADRTSRVRVLGWVLIAFAAGVIAVAFGSLPVALLGCLLFGLGLAAWMLPVSLVNAEAEPGSVAWRTALYRAAVDAGIFVGPVLGGVLLSYSLLGPFCAAVALALASLGVVLLRRG
jgi:MFS family permease